MRRTIIGLLLSLLVVGTAARAEAPVEIVLDHQTLRLDVPARIENGRTLVPLRAVAEALGVPLHWSSGGGGGTVYLYTYPVHFSPLGGGSALRSRSAPGNLSAVGAAAALTQYLTSKQQASLAGPGPGLVRFEFLDLRDLCRFPPPESLAEGFCDEGFSFAVRSYYVRLKDGSVPLTVARWVNTASSGGRSVRSVWPEFEAAWYEDITIDVRPVTPPVVEKEDNREIATFGASGWKVDEHSQSLLRKVTLDRAPYVIHGSFGR